MSLQRRSVLSAHQELGARRNPGQLYDRLEYEDAVCRLSYVTELMGILMAVGAEVCEDEREV